MTLGELIYSLLFRGKYRQIRFGLIILAVIIWWVAAGITQSDFHYTRRVGFYLLIPSTLLQLVVVYWYGYDVCRYLQGHRARTVEPFWPPRRPLQVDARPADVEQGIPGPMEVQELEVVHRPGPARESVAKDGFS